MREINILQQILVFHKLIDKCSINGFGKGSLCLDLENQNWIVYDLNEGKIRNKQIHLKSKYACKDILERLNRQDLIENFNDLCKAIED